MPLDLPSNVLEIEQRSKTDIERDLPGIDPFKQNSVAGAVATANANRTFDFYGQLDLLQKNLMPDTAVGEFLEKWASVYKVQRLAATKATGNVITGGTVASSIPIGTNFAASSGEIYESTATIAITNKVLSVTSITRSGSTATLTTSVDHELSTNIAPTVAGAVETEYNLAGLTILSIPTADTITYQVADSAATPATGTITLSFDSAVVAIQSENFQNSADSINVNLDSGASVTLQSPIVGVDNVAGVGFVPVGGGTDQETNAQMRIRFLDRIQNPVAHFNVSDIIRKAREVAGVTRVFVEEITPLVGQVTIYFMRDNDADPIPDAGEVTTVKNKILTIKPATTGDSDVIVTAPTAVASAFTFTSLTPNTVTMQTAVTANLQQFFEEETTVGVDIQEDAYRAAIQNTIDTENGDRVTEFVISLSGDIVIASGQIGTLGTVTYP